MFLISIKLLCLKIKGGSLMKSKQYIALLFFIVSPLLAKQMGNTIVPVRTTPERTIPQPQKPVYVQPVSEQSSAQSYASALAHIKTRMNTAQILQNNRFTPYFINFVKDAIKNSGNNAFLFAQALFQAGAYLHIPFMNENVINATIISDLNDEIDRQTKILFAQNKPERKIIPVQPIQPEPIIKNVEPVKPVTSDMYVVPTDMAMLRKLDLYPLFAVDGGIYFVFNPQAQLFSGEIVARFEGEDVGQNAPCIVPLGKFGSWNRKLMQLKSLNQFELSAATGLAPALCAGHSLNNGRLMRAYALSGDVQYLRDLHDIQKSAIFLLDHHFGEWLYARDVRNSIATLGNELGTDGVDVSVISTVSLFDADLDKKNEFALFDQQEFTYVQKVKQNIRAGLQKNSYVHIMVVGNEETVGGEEGSKGLGHYFCFVIIKAGNNIQYIVLDTSSRAYHLQQGSHERDRLMFIIQNIEGGKISAKVSNIQVELYKKLIQ